MSRQEWNDLPWWEGHLLLEGLRIERESESGNAEETAGAGDLTGADADLSGFNVRTTG